MELKVSIVIPVYNSEKTVGKCLDSLISQTYKDLEIICINDCSKDNSLSILNQYAEKDPRIVVINHKENKNAGGARNSGIKAAHGYYICCVDNDDWLTQNAIKMMVERSNDGNADIIASSRFDYFSEERKPIIHNLPAGRSLVETQKAGLSDGFTMLGTLIKKSLFEDNNLYYPEKIFYEDNPIALSILLLAKEIVAIDDALYYYYHSPTSVTGFTNVKKINDRIQTTDLFLENIERYALMSSELKPYVNLAYLKLTCYTVVMLCKIPRKDGCSILKELKRKIKDKRKSAEIRLLSNRNKFIVKAPVTFYLAGSIVWIVKCALKK